MTAVKSAKGPGSETVFDGKFLKRAKKILSEIEGETPTEYVKDLRCLTGTGKSLVDRTSRTNNPIRSISRIYRRPNESLADACLITLEIFNGFCKCKKPIANKYGTVWVLEEKVEIDHRHPASKGHPLISGNCQILCSYCNRRKSDQSGASLNSYLRDRGTISTKEEKVLNELDELISEKIYFKWIPEAKRFDEKSGLPLHERIQWFANAYFEIVESGRLGTIEGSAVDEGVKNHEIYSTLSNGIYLNRDSNGTSKQITESFLDSYGNKKITEVGDKEFFTFGNRILLKKSLNGPIFQGDLSKKSTKERNFNMTRRELVEIMKYFFPKSNLSFSEFKFSFSVEEISRLGLFSSEYEDLWRNSQSLDKIKQDRGLVNHGFENF